MHVNLPIYYSPPYKTITNTLLFPHQTLIFLTHFSNKKNLLMTFLIIFSLFLFFTLINSLFFPSSKLLLFLHSLLLSTKTPTQVLKNQSPPRPPNLNALFATVDADFLRHLGLHDFDADLKSLDNEELKELFLSKEEEKEEEIREAFEVFDGNGDGKICVEELGLVLKSFGMREGDCVENCLEMIRRVDLDGDGLVDFHEFKRMMHGC